MVKENQQGNEVCCEDQQPDTEHALGCLIADFESNVPAKLNRERVILFFESDVILRLDL